METKIAELSRMVEQFATTQPLQAMAQVHTAKITANELFEE